jgi:NADPH-dependent curcumin reductase CurA
MPAPLAQAPGLPVLRAASTCDWLVSELGFDAAIDYKSEEVK